MPVRLVILFAASVTAVKCIFNCKVLLQCQVILGVDEVKLEVKEILKMHLKGIEPSAQ